MTSNKKLSKKDIRGLFWRSLPMEFSWHYERQMHMGFTFMLASILQKLYGNDKEKLAQALQRHMEFFNCTPALSSFIGGIVASMEEKNASDEDFDTSSINTIKSALMGPLSGIGDHPGHPAHPGGRHWHLAGDAGQHSWACSLPARL